MDYIYKDYKLDLSGNPFRTEYSDQDYAANKTELDNILKGIFASVGLVLDTTNIYNAKIAYQYTNSGPRLEWKGDLYLQKSQRGVDALKWKDKQAGYQSTTQIVNNTFYLNNGSGTYNNAEWRWLNLFEISELINPEYAYLKENLPYFNGIWEYMELRDQDSTLTDSSKKDDNQIFQLSKEKEQSWDKGSRLNNFFHYAIPNYHIVANGIQQRINGFGCLTNENWEKDNSFQYNSVPKGLTSNKAKEMQFIDVKPELWYNNFSTYSFNEGEGTIETTDTKIVFKRNGQIIKEDSLDSGEYYKIYCTMDSGNFSIPEIYGNVKEEENTFYKRYYTAVETMSINFNTDWSFHVEQILSNNQLSETISTKAKLILQSFYTTGTTSSSYSNLGENVLTTKEIYDSPIYYYLTLKMLYIENFYQPKIPYIKINNKDQYTFNPVYMGNITGEASKEWDFYEAKDNNNDTVYHTHPKEVKWSIGLNCSHPDIETVHKAGDGHSFATFPYPIAIGKAPVYWIPFIDVKTGENYQNGNPFLIIKLAKKTS